MSSASTSSDKLSLYTDLTYEPDISNKTLVLSLAELAGNAYHEPHTRNTTTWRNSTKLFRYIDSYGWDVDGLRGHVFKHANLDLLVISVKGTSLNSSKDKESANMICSCNCCYSNCTSACDIDRLRNSLPHMYLSLLLEAYRQLQTSYPDHDIWFTGHSMGAVIASLAGVKTCHTAIGFSAPGEQLFASRIGLNHTCSQKTPNIYHIGYYKDPIYTSKCGWLCWIAGYRMDSKCHHGYECVYNDDKQELYKSYTRHLISASRWLRGLGGGLIYTHTINFLIDKIIAPSENVPVCVPVSNCTEKCDEDSNISWSSYIRRINDKTYKKI